MPMEYIVPSLWISVLTKMTDEDDVEQRLSQLIQMEKERFIAWFHQTVEKQIPKSWRDHHIWVKPFKVGGLVLLYDSKIFKHPGKLKTY